MMSCIMCRLSKMAAARGCAAVNRGAMAGVIGITAGKPRVESSTMRQKRVRAVSTPARFVAGVSADTSGSYSPTWSQ
jgi:hypothetical protein